MVRSFTGFARCTFLSFIGLLALLALPEVLLAQQTIHVPADQPTIQAAINAANNGDTVLVAPGTYVENINFIGKAITVTSSGGPSVTIIDGNANGSVVTFNSNETTSAVLNGFTIRNGLNQTNNFPCGLSGGGICIYNASPTVSGNVVTSNQATQGAGISISFSSAIINGNTITLNHQCCGSGGPGGGGIFIGGLGSVQILNNTISNNTLTSADGGGISLFNAGTPVIQGNLISGNSVSGISPAAVGGGIALFNQSDALILQNSIVGNTADQGAGIAADVPSGDRGPFLVNNTIANNNSHQLIGSGVLIEGFDTQAQLINNIVVGLPGQNALSCGSYPANLTPIFQSNDIFAAQGSTYAGNCTDQSGLNGNISSDPLFMSAANGDFHLKLGSPAIDAGDNSAPNLPATDFDGNPRVVDGNNDGTATVDFGAYEVGNTSAGSLSPASLVFSPQPVGVTSTPQPAILNSTGATAFQVTSVQTSGDFTQTTTCQVISSPGAAPGVPSGNSCGFNVFFTPTINGPGTGFLTVNGTNGSSLQVALSGSGFTPAPAVSLTPSPLSISAQMVGTTSAPQPVTLTNTGTASLNISSITSTQPFAQTSNCPAALAPAANCTINVTFQPTVSGNATGTLSVVDNALGTPHTVNLSGTGNPIPQPVTITLVQHTSRDAGTTTSSSLAFSSNNTAGNWIAVAIRAGHSGQSFTVKDSKGNAYKQAVQFNVTTDAPNGDTLGIFYAENIAGGANQVTVSDTISSTMRIAILEYSGVASANSLDTTAAAQGSSKTPNSGTITTSANGDLLLGAVLTANGQNFTAGPGYLIEEHVPAEPNTKLIAEDQVQSASSTASAGVSMTASDNWGAAIAAFKSATTSVSTSPTITSLNPASGVPGNSVTITGTNFGSTQGTSTVTFNGGAAATATSWGATSISVPVPAGATTGNVVVTVGGVASNGVVFTVIAPMIAKVSPSFGPVGASVTITGTNFGATQGTSTVEFVGTIGNLATATPTSWSNTSIVATVPAGATTGTVVVTGPVGSGAAPFTVTPTITQVSPSFGPAGASVSILGTNFGSWTSGNTVTFNGTPAFIQNITNWIDTGISFQVPSGATTGPVVVTVGGFASNSVNFTVTPVTITSLNPTSGPVGTPVTITGTNFGPTQGTSFVSIGGFTATPTSWSQTSIVAPVPPGAMTGSVAVTVGGVVSSNALPFTVSSPSISSLSANIGPVGTAVTITGTNFGMSQGPSTITFNGTAATPTSWSSTSIVTPVPTGATNGNIVVTVGGVASNGVYFAPNPPNISALNPTSGLRGSSLTITGTYFGASQGSSIVSFAGVNGTPTSWSDTSITVPVPAGAAYGNDLFWLVVNGIGSNNVIFTVLPPNPSISNINPSNGQVGTSVTITGTNFGVTQGASTVAFNGTAATPTSWSGTSVIVPVPTGATTGNVFITVGGLLSNGYNFIVTQPPPSITALSPTSGPVGTSVTITGTNFGAQNTGQVIFNGTPATPTIWSATSIVVPVPTGASTGNVAVSANGALSNGISFTVTTPPPSITSLSPTSGPVGSSVFITGTSFGPSLGSSTVTFNGTPATIFGWTSSSASVVVPNGATTGNVVVTVNGAASNGVAFTLTPPPSITSLNPASGSVGTSVTITGANFGASQGTGAVTFNGSSATPTSWSAGSIVVPVPTGATTGPVFVTISGGVSSNGVPFTVNSVSPSIVLVQHTSKDAGTTSSSSLAFNANNAAGNFIAVVIRAGKSGQGFTVSDSRGNVYKQAVLLNMTVDADTVGIYYAENIGGGANTISISDTILGTLRFAVLEYYGVATSNSLDVTAAAEGTSSAPATGTVTTNFSGDLLLGEVITANPATFNPGSGYTIEEHVPVEPNTKLLVEDQRQPIAGSAVAGASLGVSDHWGAILAAFRHP